LRRNRVVFWQGAPSPHQSSYIRALTNLLPGTNIICVFDHPIKKERLELGWSEPDLGPIETIMSPDMGEVSRLALHDPENSVHIFSGSRLSLTRRALPLCAPTSALTGLLSEARDWEGWLGKLRILHSFVAERRDSSRIDFVLAIGHRGADWYRICGYPEYRIFPWGYLVEKPALERRCGSKTSESPEVVLSYVGRCVRGKGIDTLLQALSKLPSKNWRLQVVGDGPQRQDLDRMCKILGISNRVSFLGVQNNAHVRNILAATDLLVFPSKIDGWGAVVNEALMSGSPVVCSDYCGAADLVRASGCGEIFETGSTSDLQRVLDKWIAMGPLADVRRNEIRNWSKCIDGDAAARYLIEIIDHVDNSCERPVTPWFQAGLFIPAPAGDNRKIQ
jgi:glycosyltransferase involved in cell wall biosynthesis